LEFADPLRDALAETRQFPDRTARVALQQLERSTFEADKARRVDAVGEVAAHGPNRRLVAEPEADRVDHVVEVLAVALREAERHVVDTAIHVSRVVKDNAANVVADERKAQLDDIEQ
jgi:hypothetical protein